MNTPTDLKVIHWVHDLKAKDGEVKALETKLGVNPDGFDSALGDIVSDMDHTLGVPSMLQHRQRRPVGGYQFGPDRAYKLVQTFSNPQQQNYENCLKQSHSRSQVRDQNDTFDDTPYVTGTDE